MTPEQENTILKSKIETLNQLLAVTEEVVSQRTADLRKSNEKLHETSVYLSAIIDNMADGLLVTDTHGTITRVNPALTEMFGKKQEELLNRHIKDTGFSELADLVQKGKDTGKGESLATELSLADGRFAKAVATSIYQEESSDTAPSLMGKVILLMDITKEKEVDRVKTEFISTVSHELRTPLTSVLGFAKLIKGALEDVIFPSVETDDEDIEMEIEDVKDDIGIIVSEGERLTALINDVLDIAKMEAGKIDWKSDPVCVSELIDRATSATSSLFTDKSIELIKEIQEGLPNITGDMDRLIQVVINLLSNAVKFTDEGEVRCGAVLKGSEIVVSVTDAGVGISDENKPKVFEKFKQVGDTLTDKPKGTGLGLPICKEIVRHHNGRIWVEDAPEKGSHFSFSIPVSTDERIPIKTEDIDDLISRLRNQVETRTPTSAENKKTVLVVDDEENIRKLLKKQLESEGYIVRLAQNGEEAVNHVKQEKPDLIILDVMMPGMNGFEVATILKSNPETMGIPILILSIVANEAKEYRTGIDSFLAKPFKEDELLSEINMLISMGASKKDILIIDEDRPVVKKLAQVLEEEGYRVVCAYDSSEGIERAKAEKPDMIILDARFSNRCDMVNQLRFEKGLENTHFVLIGKGNAELLLTEPEEKSFVKCF
ncbi:MAG: response regulator [Desulfobacterales bacterium]|nr:response regulator [Desulfobacterales bacterium]